MACDRFLELLSARLDGALTEEEERELEEHLAACPDCRAVGAQLSALQGAFPELEEDAAAPEGFARGVMNRIRAAETPKVIPLFKRPQVRALAGLAACLVLVVGLYGASQQKKQADWDIAVRSFNKDALTVEEECPQVSASLADPESADAPQITSYAAPEGGEVRKAAPSPSVEGLDGDQAYAEAVLTLDRMPDGAAELIPPETAVMPTDDRQGSIYLDLPLEVLDQIERLAQEQGISVTAERCSAPEAEVRYNLEILQPD